VEFLLFIPIYHKFSVEKLEYGGGSAKIIIAKYWIFYGGFFHHFRKVSGILCAK